MENTPFTKSRTSALTLSPSVISAPNPTNNLSISCHLILSLTDLEKISVHTGEKLQTVITRDTLEKLNLQIGAQVWLSFKRAAVIAF